ncbi:hypothetical protein [Pelodictyon luteolum]|nr:hypothetical protein [Pelodictyon luteolum]
MNQLRSLRGLLWAMSQTRTFYILGAGASYGLIPVTQDLRRNIESAFHSVGVYQSTPAAHGQLFERLFGDISKNEPDLRKLLLMHMPPSALDFLVQHTLSLSIDGIIPSQYAVFDVVGAPATFCNFNLDGLASKYCGHRHDVFEMHGRVDSALVEKARFSDLLEATVVYGVRFPHITPKLLPQVEPATITQQNVYSKAGVLFKYARAVVILGYSFGQRSGGFDDIHSFRYVVSLLKSNPLPVFVVSPTPDDLAELLRDTLSWRYVYAVALRWEFFSAAVLANVGSLQGIGRNWLDILRRIIRDYEAALDAS